MLEWVDASNGCVPADAWDGQLQEGVDDTYIARAEHEGALGIATLIPSRGAAYVIRGTLAYKKKEYQVRFGISCSSL